MKSLPASLLRPHVQRPLLGLFLGLLACTVALPSRAQDGRPVVVLPIASELSPNQDDRPKGAPIDTIIVHDTKSPGVTDADDIARWFARRDAEVSAHYVIGKGGEIVQCVPDDKRAWHAGPSHFRGRTRVNNFSIGIELVNDETGTDPFTDEQYAALIALAADLITRHHIPLERIVGHRDVTDYPKERQDPADNFDWARFRTGLRATLARKIVRRIELDAPAIGDIPAPRPGS